jgi:tetratricopeptide (TPR) repeat protein
MRTGLIALIALLTVAFPASAQKGRLELRGRIIPPLKSAWVGLQSATEPFRSQTLSDLKGRFKFKDLRPGGYALVLFHPHWGEQRRSVEVTPSFADRKSRIEVNFIVKRSKQASERYAEERHSVSVRELSVSQKARDEFLKANERVGKHDIAGATRHLRKAIEISPQYVEAWNQLGTIAYQGGEYEQAEEHFREALLLQSDAFGPVVNMGAALLALGRHTEALSYNRYAATLRSRDALANSQLGRNHFLLGSAEQAIKYLRKAKGIDPDHFSLPQVTLAEIYSGQGRVEAAIRELEDYIARHPDSQRAETTRKTLARLKADLKAGADKITEKN